MYESFKFPKGYDVTVVRAKDIVKELDDNIDKDVISAIIEQCETDAAEFIKNNVWTGIPFMGNIRIPKRVQRLCSKETKELIEEAKQTLDVNQYYIFRKQLHTQLYIEEKSERYKNFITSRFVNHHKELFKKYKIKYGFKEAKFRCYLLANLKGADHNTDNHGY